MTVTDLPSALQEAIAAFRARHPHPDPAGSQAFLRDRHAALAAAHPGGDLFTLGAELERASCQPEAWAAMCTRPDPKGRGLPDWDGTPLAGRRLLVEKRSRDIGADLRMGRLIGLAGPCTAWVEPRLVPLFARSFPRAAVAPAPPFGPAPDADLLAGYEVLGAHLTPDAATIAARFLPLRADPARVADLRAAYRDAAGGGPVVGLSWHSDNAAKDLPSLADWAGLVAALPATCASVNYGDRTADIAALEAASGRPVLPDPVDQLASLDDLAAQLAALDAVVSISNSTAHLAGAMGLPLHLVLTTFPTMSWPLWGDRTPWYPSARMHRKTDGWPATLARVARALA